MTSSQLRADARANLTGKWGKAALLTLCYTFIVGLINFALKYVPFFGPIASVIIDIPISFGILCSFIKLKRGEKFSYVDFLSDGFSSFGKSWAVAGNIILKMLVPIILFVISIVLMTVGVVGSGFMAVSYAITGYSSNAIVAIISLLAVIATILFVVAYIWIIIKGFYYVLSYYILYDNPNMNAKDVVQKSEDLMKEHRWAYFCLNLSFIGWAILSVFTLGIGFLWLLPYMMIACIFFYEVLSGKSDSNLSEVSNVEVIEE